MLSKEAQADCLAGERQGCHSSRHWYNVSRVAVLLAMQNGGDPAVASAFGWYHDCRRENDGEDPDHGHRGAVLALKHWQNGWLDLTREQADLLMFACQWHTAGHLDDDPTVQACWDADRLDLPRVGKIVDPYYLNTDAAKEMVKLIGIQYIGVCDCG